VDGKRCDIRVWQTASSWRGARQSIRIHTPLFEAVFCIERATSHMLANHASSSDWFGGEPREHLSPDGCGI